MGLYYKPHKRRIEPETVKVDVSKYRRGAEKYSGSVIESTTWQVTFVTVPENDDEQPQYHRIDLTNEERLNLIKKLQEDF